MKISNLSLRAASGGEAIQNDVIPINPHVVLDSLKQKCRRFESLEKEGLIHKNDLPMKEKLRQAIGDLEILIGELEDSK